ncbi:MAG: two-component sensor histidine kinase, partial [Pseudomonas sp.]|nr:two-component sensor histidine kinase [Pseudomonas sp.]
MLRLYLRLYLILALGLAGSIWLVNYGLDAYMPESNETYNREALRGPAWALVEQLRPVQAEARQARLDELQPHYGLRLKLVQRDTQDLSEREQKLLAADQVVVREDFMKFLAPIDDGPQLLEIRLPEEPKWLYLWAYGFLGVSLAIVLYFW